MEEARRQNQQRLLYQEQERLQLEEEKAKLEERERGFNVYWGGANQPKEKGNPQYPGQSANRGRQDAQPRGVRRQWRDSSKSNERSPLNTKGGNQQYFNPFEVRDKYEESNPEALIEAFKPNEQHGVSPLNQPTAANRRRWGDKPRQQIDVGEFDRDEEETKKIHDESDEDNYSDDFEEDIQDNYSGLHVISEQTNESKLQDTSNIQEECPLQEVSSQHLEQFLKTATAEEMDIIRESLSNFQDKNFSNFGKPEKTQDEEYIEEEFEEEIPEDDNEDEDSDELKFEVLKKEPALQSKASKRPVSAVYDLNQFRTANQSQLVQGTQPAYEQPFAMGNYASSGNFSKPLQPPGTVRGFSSKFERQEEPKLKQNQGFASKPSAVGNPLRRPFSEANPGKRNYGAAKFLTERQGPSQTEEVKAPQLNPPAESVVSKKDQEISLLIQAITQLDDSQRQNLLQLFQSKKMVPGKHEEESQGFRGEQSFGATDFGIPQSLANHSYLPRAERTMNEIRIRILSTHGDPHMCGLTEIELFDSNLSRIVLLPPNISLTTSVGSKELRQPQMSTACLVNGQKMTSDPRVMWVGRLPSPQYPPVFLEICVSFALSIQPAALKIWNFNKSARDSTKGVREAEVLFNDKSLFKGEIKKGQGSVDEDYSTIIPLQDQVEVQKLVEANPKQYQSVPQLPTATEAIGKMQPVASVPVLSGGGSTNLQTYDTAKRQNLNEKSLSPEETPSSSKPVWLQQSSKTSQRPKQPSVSPMTSKLNKRQQEQREQRDKQQDYMTTPSAVTPKQEPLIEQSAASIQWPSKVAAKQGVQWPSQQQPQPDKKFEDSLNSLDYFGVTHKGRIQKPEDSKRAKWGASKQAGSVNSKTLASDISSSSEAMSASRRKQPKIMKNPFPEEACLPSPYSTKKQSRAGSKVAGGAEVLDSENTEIGLKLNEALKAPKRPLLEEDALLDDIAVPDPVTAKPLSQDEKFKAKIREFEEPFVIPQLPKGNKLVFNIVQTWGDVNYVGLTGIEVYDDSGAQVSLGSITADPADINLLVGQGNDPRTVDKLVDQVNFTTDDFHTWLTPFTRGEDHTITISLPANFRISMIRIWNYNKSRIHSFRGARLVSCHLSGQLIFRGEIAKAPGNTKDLSSCQETILFTDSMPLLERIAEADSINTIQPPSTAPTEDEEEEERPLTASKCPDDLLNADGGLPTSMFDERPQTRAVRRFDFVINDNALEDNKPNLELDDFKPQVKQKKATKPKGVKGRVIDLNITESWGDLFYVGLNGIEVYDVDGNKIEIDPSNLEARPRDMNAIPGHSSDHRVLENLLGKANNTTSDVNMWLIPFNEGEDHTIKIDLGRIVRIGSIKFFNYNKSPEDSLRGAKQIFISIDGVSVTDPKVGVTLRKAPGTVLRGDHKNLKPDFGQEIELPFAKGWTAAQIAPLHQVKRTETFVSVTGVRQEFEPTRMPIGFTFRFNLFSTHGDHFYVGLNGIELLDQFGDVIPVEAKKHVWADPVGVCSVKGMEQDGRTIDKLFNGVNETEDDSNMWLAPFKFTRSRAAAQSSQQTSSLRVPNYVEVMFDSPVCLGALRLWNYRKTPDRGVHEFELVVDDKQVFRGFAAKAEGNDLSTAVVFNPRLCDTLIREVRYDAKKKQDVSMINERKIVNRGKVKQGEKFVLDEAERPTTKHGTAFRFGQA